MAVRRPKARQGVQSIEVGIALLRVLAKARGPQMLKALATSAGMPAAKAHRYLVSLVRAGLVEQHPESGRYDLGPFALDLGLGALGRLEPVTVASPTLEALRAETGQTVALAVWANGGATIVRWLGADTPVAASLRLGSVMPLTRSATGRVFISFLPAQTTDREVRLEISDNRRKRLMPATRQQVDRIVQSVRRQGFAYTSDFIPGIAGIAVPVLGQSGSIEMALIALGYSKPFDLTKQAIAKALLREADKLAGRLGWAHSHSPGA
jgi:DNA-binding IclR family transcriptional regulator